MKELVLMRHGKSDWGDSSLSDRDRPLTARGRKDVGCIAAFLAAHNLIPEVLLSSSAKRTVETAELLLPEWGAGTEVIYDPHLYLASADQIRSIIRSDHLDCGRLMVLGHNPGMGILAGQLGATVEPKFPTAAVAAFAIETSAWHAPWQKATPILQVSPKTLKEDGC